MKLMVAALREEEIPAAAALETLCFSDAAGFDAFVRNPRCFYASAVLENGELIGYGGISVAADEAEILNIAVHPSFRRLGVGVRLMRVLIDAAQERGACSLYLEVRASNVAAAALYRSLGFETIGVRKNYYTSPREDAVLMSLSLGEREEKQEKC